MSRQVNPLYFWLGVIGVAAVPLMLQLGVPVSVVIGLVGAAALPLVIGILAAGVAASLNARRKTARSRKGAPTCGKCGYDLRASPDRCPECGSPVDPLDAALIRYFQGAKNAAEGEPVRFKVRRRPHGAPARG